MTEIFFHALIDYEGLYEINKNGDIKTIKRQGTDERIIRSYIGNNGYKRVCLYKDKKGKGLSIHRLLAIQFLENPFNYPIVDHIDRNKLNNNLQNLRWTTYSINNSNIEHKGCIYIDKKKYKDKEYIYYRVEYKGERKRFKTIEEAEEFLNLKKFDNV
jgi:hypothetical protein